MGRQAREVRQGFVRKVLGLVLLQLLITAGASFAFLYVQPLKVTPRPCAPACGPSCAVRWEKYFASNVVHKCCR